MWCRNLTRHGRNCIAQGTQTGLCKEPLSQDVGSPRAFTAKKEAYAPVTASQPTARGIAAERCLLAVVMLARQSGLPPSSRKLLK